MAVRTKKPKRAASTKARARISSKTKGAKSAKASRKAAGTRAVKKTASAPSIPQTLPDDLKSLVDLLEKSWPTAKTRDVTRVFSAIRAAARPHDEEQTLPADTGPTAAPAPEAQRPRAPQSFDLLDLLRRTLTAHDLLFLRRRITYHIAASAGLSRVHADPDRVQAATASLLEYMATHAPRGSRITVQLKEIPLRSGSGIEVLYSGTDDSLHHIDKTAFLQRMYEAESEDGVVLVHCREIIASQGGQMWADLPSPSKPLYHMILPSSATAVQVATQPHQMFKYDISIANYANVRKRFGIKKSLSLVGQIEMYVRALVRHPIDIVTAVREKGVITTIYESPRGAAQSVASRISQRLGNEEFHIGKRAVDLLFRYNLAPLRTSTSYNAEAVDKGLHAS